MAGGSTFADHVSVSSSAESSGGNSAGGSGGSSAIGGDGPVGGVDGGS